MRLENKIVIVAGGGGLIGREIVKECRKDGAVVINVDYATNRWGERPDMSADITKPESIDEVITTVMENMVE